MSGKKLVAIISDAASTGKYLISRKIMQVVFKPPSKLYLVDKSYT